MITVTELKQAFSLIGDPKKRVTMMAYLKNKFGAYGITSPVRKNLQKELFPEIRQESTTCQWQLIMDLFKESERELHYFAIDLLNKIPTKHYTKSDLERVQVLLQTGSWWDSVDAIASNFVGKWFKRFPEERDQWIEKWRNSDDIWLHRTCLIFQLKYHEATDMELLESLIEQFQPNKTFFIQKAIGWSLRQQSRYEAQWVQDIVEKQKLEGLAKREALKLINK